MTLTKLVNTLREETDARGEQLAQERWYDRSGLTKILHTRVSLPDCIKDQLRELDMWRVLSRDNKEHTYYMHLSAFPLSHLIDERKIRIALEGVIEKAKSLNLRKREAKFYYEVEWNSKEFQKIEELNLFRDHFVSVNSTVHEKNPLKPQYTGTNFYSIRGCIFPNGNELEIEFEGRYIGHTKRLIKALKPQYAILQLTSEDLKRLGLRKGKKIVSYNVLTGQIKDNGLVEVVAPLEYVERCSEIIGDSLWRGSREESHISKVVKKYNLFNRSNKNKLRDLQLLAREMEGIDLGLLYDRPLITEPQAKGILEREIFDIREEYSKGRRVGSGVYNLIREYFGQEFLDQIPKKGNVEKIEFLKSKGYRPSFSYTGSFIEEINLLEFYIQRYSEDPQGVISKYREWYVNKRPEFEAHTHGHEGRSSDASKLKKFTLPQNSRIKSFGMKDTKKYGFNTLNHFYLSYNNFSSHIECEIDLSRPLFLPVQKYMLDCLGIGYKLEG